MIDTFALLVSHGMMFLVVLRLFKVRDPEKPGPPELPKRPLPIRRGGPPRA